jgi:serine/threonine protein kinase
MELEQDARAAELQALQSEIAALRADLVEPPPEPADSDASWSWVTSSACAEDQRIGDGAGCVGVYKLTNPVTGEAFACKMVDRMQHHAADAKHSFEREVEIFNRLRHPGICRLRKVISEPEKHLLVRTRTRLYVYRGALCMYAPSTLCLWRGWAQVIELCEGGELFDIVAASGGLPEDQARTYFREILTAVEYCHAQGVFHRDLKLENVLRDTDGRLKVSRPASNRDGAVELICYMRAQVTDFGMAKDTSVSSMPKTKRIGTIAYMAPEVAEAANPTYDGAGVDVWSMGVMLYVCPSPRNHRTSCGVVTPGMLRGRSWWCATIRLVTMGLAAKLLARCSTTSAAECSGCHRRRQAGCKT